jgi:hypothetical protein
MHELLLRGKIATGAWIRCGVEPDLIVDIWLRTGVSVERVDVDRAGRSGGELGCPA